MVLLRRGIELRQYRDGARALLGIGASNPEIVIAPTDMTGIDLGQFVTAVVELTGIPILVGVLGTQASHAAGFWALERGARGLIPLPSSAERIAASIAPLGLMRAGTAGELRIGHLTLSPQSLRARVDGVNVHLTPKEFDVLKYLMMESPRVVSIDELTAHGRESGPGAATRARLAVLRTRKKLSEASKVRETFIETVRGVGYRMATDD